MTKRSDSYDYVDEELDLNPNCAWIHSKVFWTMYVFLIFASRAMLASVNAPPGHAWTIVVFSHAAVTFVLFHWLKGNPLDDWTGAQGKFHKLTWWEQLQYGRVYTPTKKFLTLIPVALFFCAAYHLHENDVFLLVLNAIVSFILVLAKLPAMHKVRIMDINKG
eukprot:ANDGO_06275.mRNA.1 Uncharacterized protein C119.09c